jgi:hypothetical protein
MDGTGTFGTRTKWYLNRWSQDLYILMGHMKFAIG